MVFTHSQRLERWLGKEQVDTISQAMKDWYGPPIGIAGIPGNVWAVKGGDFQGRIQCGEFVHVLDFIASRWKRIWRNHTRRMRCQANTGFASLSDLIAEATAGKRQECFFFKTGATGVAGVTNSLWGVGSVPPAGANASNAPSGDAPTKATLGALYFENPSGTDTLHFVTGSTLASVAGNTLLLYDRIFQVNKTMNSTAPEEVTGVPTRYQSTTPGAPDFAGGNFLFVEVGGTALAATAHNWTECRYIDELGNPSILPSLTGVASAIVRRLDHAVAGQWFAPLADGDFGIKALTQMQCSAAVATGVINFVIGHPLCFMPHPVANLVFLLDGINTAFNLVRIFPNAALGFLEISKPSTTATTYTGSITLVSG